MKCVICAVDENVHETVKTHSFKQAHDPKRVYAQHRVSTLHDYMIIDQEEMRRVINRDLEDQIKEVHEDMLAKFFGTLYEAKKYAPYFCMESTPLKFEEIKDEDDFSIKYRATQTTQIRPKTIEELAHCL